MRLVHLIRLALFAGSLAPPLHAETPATIFAAASLTDVLEEAVERRGQPARLVLAGSSALARQIAAGAPADLYVTAHPRWMDWLAERSVVPKGAARPVALNRLVLVEPAAASDGAAPPELGPEFGLAERLEGGRLAVALTSTVPAGRYAREALETLGLWEALAPRLVETEDVRGALALAARGEVPFALVYATDARAEPRVRVAATVPESAHAPALYLAAPVSGAPGAAAWLDWLAGPEGRALFEDHGFAPPPGASSSRAARE